MIGILKEVIENNMNIYFVVVIFMLFIYKRMYVVFLFL